MDGSETGDGASVHAVIWREGAVIGSKVLVNTAPARLETRCAVAVLLCPLLQWMVQLTLAAVIGGS